jgi:hypothetical protein
VFDFLEALSFSFCLDGLEADTLSFIIWLDAGQKATSLSKLFDGFPLLLKYRIDLP